MNDVVNSYKPCDKHANGFSEFCKDCESEALRDTLRGFANAEILGSAKVPRATIYIVVPQELWDSVTCLRR